MGIEIAVAAAVVGGAGYMGYQSYTSGKKANAALEAQKHQTEALTTIAKKQADLAQEQFDIYKKTYLPVETALAAEVKKGIPVDEVAAQAGADVGREFDNAAGVTARNQTRMGIDASSPKYQAAQGDLAMIRAAAEAGASTNARERARDTNYTRKLQTVQTGRGIPAVGFAGMSGAANSTNSAAGQYANISANYAGQSAASMQAAMGLIGLGASSGAFSGLFGGGASPAAATSASTGAGAGNPTGSGFMF
jgi:hypothetical protein